MKWIIFLALQPAILFFAFIAYGLVAFEHLFLWPLSLVLLGIAVAFEALAVEVVRLD